MSLFARLVLVAAAWAAAWQGGAACSCAPAHPQGHFCHADFVILARVKKEVVMGSERVYMAVVKRVFKASEKDAVSVMSGKIWTALDEAACGVKLHTNRTYVLAGRFLDDKARISLCSLYRQWSEVSPKQRKGFRRMYSQSCHCRVVPGMPGSSTADDECLWETSFVHHEGPDCQAEHAICMRQPGARAGASAHCGWTGGSRYRQCLDEDDDDDEDALAARRVPSVVMAPEPLRRMFRRRQDRRGRRMPRRT